MSQFFYLLLLFCSVAFGAKFPAGIPKCKINDNECLAKSITIALNLLKNGLPEIGMSKLEPLAITKLEFIGDPTKSVTLNQKYENANFYGIYDTKVTNLHVDFVDGCYWDFMAISPEIRMEADYELKGQLLVVPIDGHGKCNVTLQNLQNHHKMKCERYEKKGKTYIKIIDYQEEMKPERVIFKFENIIPGSSQISAELDKTLNENSLQIFNDVKDGFESVFNQLHLREANAFLSKFSLDELYV